MLYFGRLKSLTVIGVCLLGLLLALPNLFSKNQLESFPGFLPNKQINLGLDLQGGSYLLLQVELNVVVEQAYQDVLGELRQALRKDRIGYVSLRQTPEGVSFKLRKAEDLDNIRSLVRGVDNALEIDVNEATLTISATFDDKEKQRLELHALEQSIEIVRRRIDETGTNEPLIQRQGDDRILVQLPGVQDPERVKNLLGKTAKLTFHLVDQEIGAAARLGHIPKPGNVMMPSDDTDPLVGERYYELDRLAIITGEMLIDSQPTFQEGSPAVSFRFNTRGAKKFAETSQANVGRRFAIVLDGKVISAPVIREAILGGSGVISGSFTTETANDLSLLLRAGALPAPIQVIEERTVGPGLGADSIESGEKAGVIALLLVIGFMVLVYGRLGVIANIALFVNLCLVVGVLSALQATLTLPGIAGIVLTVGMAVDSNVLVYERIYEEIRRGLSKLKAVEAGYGNAMSSIIDANITTFIAAMALFMLGSGPVKGFAVTLTIGTISSVFTSLLVTRLIISYFFKRRKQHLLGFKD